MGAIVWNQNHPFAEIGILRHTTRRLNFETSAGFKLMTTPDYSQPVTAGSKTVRQLAHDLSNALEIIMQSSFLLGTLDLGENGRQWHGLLEGGVAKATAINQQLREALRAAEHDQPGSH
jgi:hypothetical protein